MQEIEDDIAALQNRFKPIGQAARATEAAIITVYDFTPIGDAVALTTGKDMSGNDVSGLAKAAVVVGMFSPLDEAGDVYKAGKRLCKLAKAESPVWKNLKSFRGKIKTNALKGKDKRFFTWDHTHGDIEVFDAQGKHLGSMEAVSGEMTKPPVPGRRLED